jgi:hypothetical protein
MIRLRPTGTAAPDRAYPENKGAATMATMTDPPREGFRLSQLIYDTRYRS